MDHKSGEVAEPAPFLSIVIAVYNDWAILNECLRSMAEQASRGFEVIVVDDGSRVEAPGAILDWARRFPLRVLRQRHMGIPVARNYGIHISRGKVLVFVDADCRLQANCLAALTSAIADFPQQDSFQLRLIGDCATLVGRAEELRLMETQNYLLQANGRIRYLNTAGFAIRRAKVDREKGLFAPEALRAEDTLLLVNLMETGELPLFVPAATVQHSISLSLFACFRKDLRSAFLEARTYRIISAHGLKVRVNNHERFRILWSMWKTSERLSIGRSAWFALAARQTLQRSISFLYDLIHPRPNSEEWT